MRRVLTPEQKVRSRERWRKWAKNNRERLNANVREYRKRRFQKEGHWRDEGRKAQELKAWMIELKSKPCSDCGLTFPICCMDFAHRNSEEKLYNIGSMFSHHYSKEIIQREIDKCDLVCANCHRIRTQKEKIGHGRISGISENSTSEPRMYN